jgi:hypothetical protein
MFHASDILVVIGILIFIFGFFMDVLYGDKLEKFAKKANIKEI